MGTLSDGVRTQSRFTGFAPNLFEVNLFGEDSSDNTLTLDVNQKLLNFVTNQGTGSDAAKFYCTAYELPPPSIALKQDPYTKKHYPEKYAMAETVTITWQEDRDLSVWWYHKNWLDCYYSRGTDVYKVGAAGKKRNAHILVQSYPAVNGLMPTAMSEANLPELLTVRLVGLVPKSIPPLRGSWSDDAEKGTLNITIQYSVDYFAITTDDGKTYKGSI